MVDSQRDLPQPVAAEPRRTQPQRIRTWVIDSVTRLTDVYGYKVITLSPYQKLGQTTNAPSWQALASKAYIGIEAYLSGDEVWNSGTNYASRLAWAQGRYQAAKNSYLNVGVPAEKLFVSEHFGNTVAGTKWGRAGLPAADWDQVIMIRQDAIYNVGFAGFLAYNWGGNGMGVTEAEQIQHEYYYRSRLTLPSQKPQWLSDTRDQRQRHGDSAELEPAAELERRRARTPPAPRRISGARSRPIAPSRSTAARRSARSRSTARSATRSAPAPAAA